MEFYGSEDVKCLCGAPKCRGTLGKEKDDGASLKGKGKGAKGGTPVSKMKKTAANASPKKANVKEVSAGREGKKQAESSSSSAKNGSGNAGKRKEPEPEPAAGEDEFFSTLNPREKKRQMEMMKNFKR
jgi:hypothetical protein